MLAPLKPMEAVTCVLAGWRVAFGAVGPDGTRSIGALEVRRQVLKAVLVNAAVFLVLFAAIVWGIFAATSGMVNGSADLPGWISWLGAAAGWIVRIGLLVLAASVAPTLLSLLLGVLLPMFMDPVFRAGRAHAGGPPVATPGGLLAEVTSIATDLRRLGRFILFSLLILPLNFVPVLGQLAYAVAQALLAAHTLGWDLLSYHFTLHGVGYAEQRRIVARHRPLVLSVGGVGVLLLMIPFVNLVFATTLVVGAGILSARLDGAPPQRP